MSDFPLPVRSPIAFTCGMDNNGMLYDADTEEYAVYEDGPMPSSYGSNLALELIFENVAIQSGTNKCNWAVAIMAVTPDTDDVDITVDSYDTENEGVETLANNQGVHRARALSITCTNADGLAAGDYFRIKLLRKATDAGDDTMTGDGKIKGLRLTWTDA